MGLKRTAAASLAACKALPVFNRSSSALVTNKTELEIDTPTDMIIPIYDCRFNVEPVSNNNPNEPTNTAGTVQSTTSDTLNDWKLAVSIRKITTTATSKPDCRLSNVSVNTFI